MKNAEKYRGGALPRLAMINDIAGFGRCSTAVALPVISAMEVQACPVPTCILSNHLAFPLCHLDDYTPHMRDYIHTWKDLGLTFDGLYCGFLSDVEQADIVESFIDLFEPSLFLLDPVMGDHGRAYSTVTPFHCESLKRLAKKADILTPNITEACLLTGTPYRDGIWPEAELEELGGRLAKFGCRHIVITGMHDGSHFANYIWQEGKKALCLTPRTGTSRPGTGDLFASILIADALYGRDFAASVKKAADFIALCIEGSELSDVPVREGVIFERYLKELIRQNEP